MQVDRIQQMKEMIARLNAASDAYYNGQTELMTDFEWDALFDQLKELEEETGTVLKDSPTNNVSADQISGAKEPHEFAALSLAKTKKPEDLVKWAEGRKIWMSWKLDGLTLVVTYDNGRLSKVVTRGDGHIGTNITHLAPGIQGIPETIEEKGHLVLRGEAVISYADFEEFCAERGADYANPRNLASGSLALKDIEELKTRRIHWIPFTLVYAEKEIVSWGARMDWLESLGFVCVEREAVEHPDSASVRSVIERWTNKVTDGENPYPVDGLVIGYDDTVYASTGSVTGHHATRAGYAFKWADESVESTLLHIEWSCAASTITPVAVFEPVQLEGTTVKRASLCNVSECERLGIGGRGTVLSVIKANKIIPKIIHVQHTEGALEIPPFCPVCGCATELEVSAQSGTKTLHCSNVDCPAKQLEKYKRFVSKAGMDIDGISRMTIAKFVNEGWIHEYADFFKLEEHLPEIAELDGFGEKSAENIRLSIEKARKVTDEKFLYALNIPIVGKDVAKKLLSVHPLEELIQEATHAEREDLYASIDGIGPQKSSAFVRYFKDEKNQKIVQALLEQVTVERSEKSTGSLCAGLTFVITGDVHHYHGRNELKAYIESQGGKVTGAVSKNTSYLINNDVTSTSGKNKKAQELSVPILSEEEFIGKFTA